MHLIAFIYGPKCIEIYYNYLHCHLASGEGIVTLAVTLSRCVCVHCISLGGGGNALYPVSLVWPSYRQITKWVVFIGTQFRSVKI